MTHQLLAEFMGTALMIIFGIGVHCDDTLVGTKYHGAGHIFAITTWSFGITVAIYMFGDVCINPAMALAQAMLGHIPWYMFIPISLAEVAGGFSGAVIMWICYADHFKASAGKIDPIRIRNIFSTTPGIRNLPRNFFCEFFATFIFIAGILTICHACQGVQSMLAPLGIGLLVWAIGMGMGGTTGFAMNLARDMGPRLAHAFLPIAHKADNDWQYGILVPGLAPFFGAAAAAIFVRAFFQF